MTTFGIILLRSRASRERTSELAHTHEHKSAESQLAVLLLKPQNENRLQKHLI